MVQRKSNYEILRIVAMMAVVACHYVNANIGGIDNYSSFPNFTWWFVAFIRGFSIPLVNVFVIITGFFSVESNQLSLKKIIRLLSIMVFYGFIHFLWELTRGVEPITIFSFLKIVFPIFVGEYWFIKTFCVLLFFQPFINKALNSIDKNTYRYLIAIQLGIFSIWYSIGFSAPNVDDGYGIINFLSLYIIGGYIHKYSEEDKLLKKITFSNALLIYFVMAIITVGLSIFTNPFGYAYITNIVAAVFVFLAFHRIRDFSSNILNYCGKSSFDVFFVHGAWIFKLLKIELVANTAWMIPHFMITLLICYLLGVVSYTLREKIYSPTVERLLDRNPLLREKIIV